MVVVLEATERTRSMGIPEVTRGAATKEGAVVVYFSLTTTSSRPESE